MPSALLLSVRFHDGRYHGRPDWPPSPARLFQALVAGAAKGEALWQEDRDALAWLEQLEPPVIAAPAVRAGEGFKNYVPNNDLDAVGGDPRRIGEIRAPKLIKPWLFDVRVPLMYAWQFDHGAEHAEQIFEVSERLYQLGRGVDMAFATAELLSDEEAQGRLMSHGGVVYRPCKTGEGRALACPVRGSLASLEDRFRKTRNRFSVERKGRASELFFTQPPKPRFAQVPYDSPPTRLLYELRDVSPEAAFHPWLLKRVVQLVETVRNGAAQALEEALPGEAAKIARGFGLWRDATETDKAERIRIIPLPSIGHPHAERAIRRLLVEVPPDCPLPAGDIAWAFSGFEAIDQTTGEILWTLVPAEDASMLGHYGIDSRRGEGHRLWRSVTPAALPEQAGRRRIDPSRHRDPHERKGAKERLDEEGRAATAVLQALRHAATTAKVESIRIQREPFEAKGARAEAFAPGTRFAKERLWHVEIAFNNPVAGPLILGDGRYLGLGLMAPVRDAWRDRIVFSLRPETSVAVADAPLLLRAVRRALMALSRDSKGAVPRLFSGHESDGAPARSGRHDHVFLAAHDADGDGRIDRLIVTAPWAGDRTHHASRTDRERFDQVVSRLEEVRAGRLGVLKLSPPAPACSAGDRLIGPARRWESCTSYRPTRHAGRRQDRTVAIEHDLIRECLRRGLPQPKVEVLELMAGPRGRGIVARARLEFAVGVRGPLLLGRDSHMGGGVFATV